MFDRAIHGGSGIATLCLGILASAGPARAEFKLQYPIIDYRELELEHNGEVTFDKRKSGMNNQQSYTNEVGYGVTPWWEPEIEFEWNTGPGQNLHYTATTFENTFQLTEQGKYWADLGFFAEFSRAPSRDTADSFKFGPLIQKEQNDFLGLDLLHTLNLFVAKDVGRNGSPATPLIMAWQSRMRFNALLQPGIEYYGQVQSIAGAADTGAPQHRVGPVIVGIYNMYALGKVKYELGYQFGLNSATERGALRWRLEYEKLF
jgi:hypothetical protein